MRGFRLYAALPGQKSDLAQSMHNFAKKTLTDTTKTHPTQWTEILISVRRAIYIDQRGAYIIDFTYLPLLCVSYERPLTTRTLPWGSIVREADRRGAALRDTSGKRVVHCISDYSTARHVSTRFCSSEVFSVLLLFCPLKSNSVQHWGNGRTCSSSELTAFSLCSLRCYFLPPHV
eukprot:6211774-Pleurochrysis_carterae.AAC.2